MPAPIILSPGDSVAIATERYKAGEAPLGLALAGPVSPGHKLARVALAKGDAILKFGQIIGYATEDIPQGAHVHTHNCAFGSHDQHYVIGADLAAAEAAVPKLARRSFMGFRRGSQVGTRNMIALVATVNCSATVIRRAADEIMYSGILKDYPHVDGVVAFSHGTGCAMDTASPGYMNLQRVLWGHATHPNVGAAIFVGLGCEVMQIARMQALFDEAGSDRFHGLTIQETGGTTKTVATIVAKVKELLPEVDRARRVEVDAAELKVALQCGGSDGFSGITANPALGVATDMLVGLGATGVLAETPEIYGAEQLLLRRAVNAAGRRQADRADPLVGALYRDERRQHGQQPQPRQQGRRADHHPGEIAGGGGQGRLDAAGRGDRLRRAGDAEGFRVHGQSRLRPGQRHRPDRLGLSGGGVHHRARQRLRLETGADHQARHQRPALPHHAGRHGHQLRRHRHRRSEPCRQGRRDPRDHPARRQRRAHEVRGAEPRRQRIRAMADRSGDVSFLSTEELSGSWLGRVWLAGTGPAVVTLRQDQVIDITDRAAPTARDICERDDPAAYVRGVPGRRIGALDDIAAAPVGDPARTHFLAPCDLQAVKACGVTFARSMVERVIEEKAAGDPAKAQDIRARVGRAIGDSLRNIRPGSPEAAEVKRALIAEGLWSQYLEVGIGPDAEVFSKAQVLSAVGPGAEVGLHPISVWNNPEPEVVVAASSKGRIVGACLGNDVNLRDVEGRSALLLSKAKDNNASAAIGPMIRLFDAGFGLDQVRAAELDLTVEGEDGFRLQGHSSMKEISRDPQDLVDQCCGRHHQYPDGFMLYLGTLFAPVEDRDAKGEGFTHHLGDRVTIASAGLGRLENTVRLATECAPWSFGASHLMRNLAGRGLL